MDSHIFARDLLQETPTPAMEENRKAARFVVHVPLHVRTSKDGLPQYYTGNCRTFLAPAFCSTQRRPSTLAPTSNLLSACPRQKPQHLRPGSRQFESRPTWQLPGEPISRYGVAVAIDRIAFLRPDASSGE
jgi:hypothetical protein